MTDEPKSEAEEPRADDAPSIHDGESAPTTADLADIHLAPREDKNGVDSSVALFVPLGEQHDAMFGPMGHAEAERAALNDASPSLFEADHFQQESAGAEPASAPTSAVGMETEAFTGFAAGHFSDPAKDSESATLAPTPPVAEPSPPATTAKPSGQFNMLLLTWASLATLTALYLWWTRPDYPSNLDTIPDDGALQSMLSNKSKVSPLSALDDRLIIPFGKTRRLGALEVTPIGVEHRRVRVLAADGEVAYEPSVLALKLRVKNVGGEQSFAPSDPAFTSLIGRSDNSRVKKTMSVKGRVVFEDGYTYTFAHPAVDVGSIGKRILPLAVEYSKHERVAEQEFPVLKPGESAEVLLLSQEDALQRVKGAMLWRVKLRKGRTPKGTGVATVIGVPFTKNDIAMTAPPPENRLEG